MFIQLTNVAKEHKGKPLILNTRYIVSVFTGKDEDSKPVTVVYGALQTSWNVKESVATVMQMLEQTA